MGQDNVLESLGNSIVSYPQMEKQTDREFQLPGSFALLSCDLVRSCLVRKRQQVKV
jgi:hypothetical protein